MCHKEDAKLKANHDSLFFFPIGARWPNPNALTSKLVFYTIFNEPCQHDREMIYDYFQ